MDKSIFFCRKLEFFENWKPHALSLLQAGWQLRSDVELCSSDVFCCHWQILSRMEWMLLPVGTAKVPLVPQACHK